jgi:hypothetical protein
LEALEGRVLLATNMWNVSVGGSWQTATNWSLGHVPTNGEDVVIPALSGNQTITYTSAASTIQSLTTSDNVVLSSGTLDVTETIQTESPNVQVTLQGATLGGNVTLASGSQVVWTSGKLSSGITNAGTLTISGSSLDLSGTLTNTGTINVTGSGTILAYPSAATINNQAGATFDFQGSDPKKSVPWIRVSLLPPACG